MKKVALLALALLTFTVSANAQHKVTAELRKKLNDLQSAVEGAKELTGRFNFRRRDASEALIDAVRESFNAETFAIERIFSLLNEMRLTGKYTTRNLVQLYVCSSDLDLSDLAKDAEKYQHDIQLSVELLNVSTQLRRVLTLLIGDVWEALREDEILILTGNGRCGGGVSNSPSKRHQP